MIDPSRLYTTPEEIVPFREGAERGYAEESRGDVIVRFSRTYATKRHPRIAVYVNRVLSDRVAEWRSDVRLVAGRTSSETKGGKVENGTREEGVTLTVQQRDDSLGHRLDPEETSIWAFEEAFSAPLLSAQAKLVDRALILRLTAASGGAGRASSPPSVRTIEIDALRQYADILVEVLVTRSAGSRYGYEFRATAKEIRTGMVLANVTSLHWDNERGTKRTYAATSHGYVAVEREGVPALRDVADHLAITLMQALNDRLDSVAGNGYRAGEAVEKRGEAAGSPLKAFVSLEGAIVKIEGVRVIPEQVKRGAVARLEMEYTLHLPNTESKATVEERWKLYGRDKVVASVRPTQASRAAGRWRAGVNVDIPADTEPGPYSVKNQVTSGTSYDERSLAFTVIP